MQRLGPTMMQINGDINTITLRLSFAEEKVSTLSSGLAPTFTYIGSLANPVISKAWMNKVSQPSKSDIITSIQEIPGGFYVVDRSRSSSWADTMNVQYDNIRLVSVSNGDVSIDLKSPVTPTNSWGKLVLPEISTEIFFDDKNEAREAYNFIDREIRSRTRMKLLDQ